MYDENIIGRNSKLFSDLMRRNENTLVEYEEIKVCYSLNKDFLQSAERHIESNLWNLDSYKDDSIRLDFLIEDFNRFKFPGKEINEITLQELLEFKETERKELLGLSLETKIIENYQRRIVEIIDFYGWEPTQKSFAAARAA